MAIICADNRKNIGAAQCRKFPELIKRLITVPTNWSDTYANLITQSTWQTLLKNPATSRGYLYPQIKKWENLSEEATYFANQLATSLQYQGRYQFRASFIEGVAVHRAIASHRQAVNKVVMVDNFNNAVFTSPDNGVTLYPFTVGMWNPEKIKLNDESEPTMSPVYFTLDDANEMDRMYLIPMTFINNLLQLTDVSLRIVGTPTATSIVVKVLYTETEDSAEPDNEIPILGLTQADFNLLTTAGADQNSTISGVTDNEDGTYTIAGTGMTSGTLDLVAPADISVSTYAIESVEAATVTI